jgi:hypothetical protein
MGNNKENIITDGQVQAKICNLEANVKGWAMRHDLWEGCQFFSYQSYFDDEPDLEEPCLTVLAAGDKLLRVLREPYSHITDELNRLVDTGNGYYENDGNAIYFYTYDESLQKEAIDLFQWQWICELIKPNYTDLYHELYKYFQQRPDRFYYLHWRDFEVLMYDLLKHKGFEVDLGSGRNDGGVDMILRDKNALVPFVTLVQVKKHKNPIKTDAVSALLGRIVDNDNRNNNVSHKGLLITSSRFIPDAVKFAKRQTRTIELADRTDIASWSFEAVAEIESIIKKYTRRDYISRLLNTGPMSPNGRILFTDPPYLTGQILVTTVSETFKDTFHPEFVVILHDTMHVALVMQLPTTLISGHYFAGVEVPLKALDLYDRKPIDDIIFRVRKETDSNREISFRGRLHTYFLWDGRPQHCLRD